MLSTAKIGGSKTTTILSLFPLGKLRNTHRCHVLPVFQITFKVREPINNFSGSIRVALVLFESSSISIHFVQVKKPAFSTFSPLSYQEDFASYLVCAEGC